MLKEKTLFSIDSKGILPGYGLRCRVFQINFNPNTFALPIMVERDSWQGLNVLTVQIFCFLFYFRWAKKGKED